MGQCDSCIGSTNLELDDRKKGEKKEGKNGPLLDEVEGDRLRLAYHNRCPPRRQLQHRNIRSSS